jgi:hypothetical protein
VKTYPVIAPRQRGIGIYLHKSRLEVIFEGNFKVLREGALPHNSQSWQSSISQRTPHPAFGHPLFSRAIGIYTSPLGSHFRCKSHGAATFVREVVLPRNLQSIANAPLTRPSATFSPRVRGERAG